MVKALGDVFVPILPAIVASGLIMGLLEGLCKAWPALANSGTYTIFHLFSNAAFVFLPILVAGFPPPGCLAETSSWAPSSV